MSNLDPGEAEEVGAVFNIPTALVKEIAYINDEWNGWHGTAEERFATVRTWVAGHIKQAYYLRRDILSGQMTLVPDPEPPQKDVA